MSDVLPPVRPDYLIDIGRVDDVCDVGQKGRELIEDTAFSSQSSFNVRRARRAANIVNDLFEERHFKDKRILELGPGHYAFALIARSLGAEVVCVEKDPSFVRLGRYLGFEVIDADFFQLHPDLFSGPFDGLWAKGTFNACNPRTESELYAFVENLSSLLRSDAWGWFVTVNKTGKGRHIDEVSDFVKRRVESQRRAFSREGWSALPIPEERRKKYALNYANSRYMYVRNLGCEHAVPHNVVCDVWGDEALKSSGKDAVIGNTIVKGLNEEAKNDIEGRARKFNKTFRCWQPHPHYGDNPWQYYCEFIRILQRKGVRFLTMKDALAGRWRNSDINVLIDHHIDFYPVETEVMCRWEWENDVVSSIYLFNQFRATHSIQRKGWCVEDLNIEFYQELERNGFEIGYHQNAVGTARFERTGSRQVNGEEDDEAFDVDLCDAQSIFAQDVGNLRQYFDIRTFIPHGAGEGNNKLVKVPEECRDVVWVYNNAKEYWGGATPLRWSNFSDSSGVRPQPVRVSGGRWLLQVDNLHVNARLLRRGLNHILIHPGRFGRGMPYQQYSQPEKVNRIKIEQADFKPCRPIRVDEVPLNTSKLVKAWESEAGVGGVRSESDPIGSRVQKSEGKVYVISDCVPVLRSCMRAHRLCVPIYAVHRNMPRTELKNSMKGAQSRDASARYFHLPSTLKGQSDETFMAEFGQFMNSLYADDVIKHLADVQFPVNVLHLENVAISSREQLRALMDFLSALPTESAVYVNAHLKRSIPRWRIWVDLRWGWRAGLKCSARGRNLVFKSEEYQSY